MESFADLVGPQRIGNKEIVRLELPSVPFEVGVAVNSGHPAGRG